MITKTYIFIFSKGVYACTELYDDGGQGYVMAQVGGRQSRKGRAPGSGGI